MALSDVELTNINNLINGGLSISDALATIFGWQAMVLPGEVHSIDQVIFGIFHANGKEDIFE